MVEGEQHEQAQHRKTRTNPSPVNQRAPFRIADVSINTVTKLLVDVGTACAAYQDQVIRKIKSKRVQCDEICSFCYSKEKYVAPEDKAILGHGDAYTWTAIDADTKLAISWLVGSRDGKYVIAFIEDLASRLTGRIQLTTDGHGPYLNAVEKVFGGAIDYAAGEDLRRCRTTWANPVQPSSVCQCREASHFWNARSQ